MAIEQKNTTGSSTVVAGMEYLLRSNAQTVELMYFGDRVCSGL
jgi:hypothetical protein